MSKWHSHPLSSRICSYVEGLCLVWCLASFDGRALGEKEQICKYLDSNGVKAESYPEELPGVLLESAHEICITRSVSPQLHYRDLAEEFP